MEDIIKTCTICKAEKAINLFHAKPKGKFGRDSKCISCVSIYRRQLHKQKRNKKNKVLNIINDNEFLLSETQILKIWREVE